MMPIPCREEIALVAASGSIAHDGSVCMVYMVSHLPSIYPSHVSIYTIIIHNYMDPMAWIIFFEISENHAVSLNRGILDAIQLVKQYLTSQDLLAGTDPQVKFSIHLLVI